jgi:hypothetical protein
LTTVLDFFGHQCGLEGRTPRARETYGILQKQFSQFLPGEGQAHVCKAGIAPIEIGEETVMLIMALFVAFLIGIVVGSGLEILVRSRVPSA